MEAETFLVRNTHTISECRLSQGTILLIGCLLHLPPCKKKKKKKKAFERTGWTCNLGDKPAHPSPGTNLTGPDTSQLPLLGSLSNTKVQGQLGILWGPCTKQALECLLK